MSNESKLGFIYKALEDAENTVRFLDTKVGGIFIVIGLILAGMGTIKDSIYDVYQHFVKTNNEVISIYLIFLFALYFIFTIVCSYYGLMVIKPKGNQAEHVNLDNEGKLNPEKLWFIENNIEQDKLSMTLEEYNSKMVEAKEEDLILIVSYELLKISYIKNKKLENINKSLAFFNLSVVALVVMVVVGCVAYTLC